MKYKVGGKINPKGDTLEYLQGVDYVLSDLEKKRNINIKFGLDVNDQKKAEELLEAFDEKSKNGMNDYYTFRSVALERLTDDYEKLKSAKQDAEFNKTDNNPEFQKMIEKRSNAIVRQANAYIALGGQVTNTTQEIFDFAKAQEKVLMDKSGGGYQYTVDNFKELFDIMTQLIPLLEKSDGLSKNFARFSIKPENLSGIAEKAKQAEEYLEHIYEEYGTGELRQGTRNEVIKSMGIVKEYYDIMARLKRTTPQYPEAYRNAAQLDIPVGFSQEESYSSGVSTVKREYDKIISQLREEALQRAEKAQKEYVEGYKELIDQGNEAIDLVTKQFDATKKQIDYLKIEQEKKLATEWGSLEGARPKFSETGDIAGAYTTNESFTAASELYDSLFDQIKEGALSADEAIEMMARDLFNAVSRGEATPVLSQDILVLQTEIETLRSQVEQLRKALNDAQEDAQSWGDTAYRNLEDKWGLEDQIEELQKRLEDKDREIAQLMDENRYLRDHQGGAGTGLPSAGYDDTEAKQLFDDNLELEKTISNLQKKIVKQVKNIGELKGWSSEKTYSESYVKGLRTQIETLKNDLTSLDASLRDEDSEQPPQSQGGGFQPCCDALTAISDKINELDMSQLTSLATTLTAIQNSVNAIKDTLLSGTGVTITNVTNLGVDNKNDPVMKQRFDELLNSYYAMFDTRATTKSFKNEQGEVVNKIREKVRVTFDEIASAIITNLPSVGGRYDYDINAFKEIYSLEKIQQLPVEEGVSRLTELLGFIQQLSKVRLGKELDVIMRRGAKGFPDLTRPTTTETQLGFSDSINQIIKTLQEIARRVSEIANSLATGVSNDIPDLRSDFLTDRGQILKDLFGKIETTKNGTFKTKASNLENVKDFLRQFNEYGDGEWNLDEFARINDVSKKNLGILKQCNEELFGQKEVVTDIADKQEELANETAQSSVAQSVNTKVVANLEGEVSDITEAVKEKNSVFEEEKTIVDTVVDAEKEKLKELQLTIDDVIEALKEKNEVLGESKPVDTTNKSLEKEKELLDDIADKQTEIKVEAYRGTNEAGFGKLSKVNGRTYEGTYYTSNPDVARTYGDYVERAMLTLKNPLVADAGGKRWNALDFTQSTEEAQNLVKVFDSQISEFIKILADKFSYDLTTAAVYSVDNPDWDDAYVRFQDAFASMAEIYSEGISSAVEKMSSEDIPARSTLAGVGLGISRIFGALIDMDRAFPLDDSEREAVEALVNLRNSITETVDSLVSLSDESSVLTGFHSADTLNNYARNKGFDSLYLKNVVDGGNTIADDIVVYDENNIERLGKVEKEHQEIISDIELEKENLKEINTLIEEKNALEKDSTIQEENAALEEEKGDLKEVNALLEEKNNLKKESATMSDEGVMTDEQASVQETIDAKDKAFQEEQEVVTNVIDAEKQKLEELKKSVNGVTEAVKKKTKAFEDEGKKVTETAEEEKAALMSIPPSMYNQAEGGATGMRMGPNGVPLLAQNDNLANNPAENTEVDLEEATLKYIKAVSALDNLLEKVPDKMMDFELHFSDVLGQSYYKTIQDAVSDLTSRTSAINAMPNDALKLDEMQKITPIISKYSSVIQEFLKSHDLLADSLSMKKVKNNIGKYIADNTALTDEQRTRLIKLREAIEAAFDPNGNNVSMTKEELKQIVSEFEESQAEARQFGNEGQSALYKVSQQVAHLNEKWVGQLLSFHDIIRYIRTMYTEIKNIDSALIELKKVTDGLTMERLNISLENSLDTARELGSEVTEVINTTADWARLGYGIEDAEELARVTTLFKNVGDNLTTDTASEYLISTLKGFEMKSDEALTIVDKFNEVANNFAIDTSGIGQALERSSASFNAANTSLSESIALVTTANAVVQNPESVGTTFKTLSARIRGATTELEELGEEEDDFTKSTSKLRGLVKGLTGFDIMEDEDTFKSIYEILIGIGHEWDKLTDVERASLGEALAGKRNSNVLFAVMNNIEELEKAYETAENAAGSATREQENYQRSIQYSVDVLKAEVSELYTKILDSKEVKGFVDLLAQGLEYVVKIADKLPAIAVIGTMFGASAFLGNTRRMGQLSMFLDGLLTATNALVNKKPQTAWNDLMNTVIAVQKSTNGGKDTALTSMATSLKNPATLAAIAKWTFGLTALIGLAYGVSKAIDSMVDSVEEIENRMKESSEKISEYDAKLTELRDRLDEISNMDMTAYSQTQQQNLKDEAKYVGELIEQYEKLKIAYEESYAKDRADLWFGEQKYNPFSKTVEKLFSGQWFGDKGAFDTYYSAGAYRGDNAFLKFLVGGLLGTSTIGQFFNQSEDNKSEDLDETMEQYEKLAQKIQKARETQKRYLELSNQELAEGGLGSEWGSEQYEKKADKYQAKVRKYEAEQAKLYEEVLKDQAELLEMREKLQSKDADLFTSQDAEDLKDINEQLAILDAFLKTYSEVPDNQKRLANHIVGEEVMRANMQGQTKEDLAGDWITQLTADELKKLGEIDLSGVTFESLEQLRDYLKDVSEEATEVTHKFENIGALLSSDIVIGPDWASSRYDVLNQEYQKELQLAKEAGAELDRTLYGNVDLNNRAVLEWDEENLNKYKDAIESWGDSVEDYADTVSTVIGTSSEFDGVEIAFTPMLQTPNGAELLDSDTVYRYIDNLISQMPEGWTTEDLLKLDAQGLEIDGKKIKGLIADVGDEARRVAETMHYLGTDGSLQRLTREMEEAKDSAVTWGDVKDDLIGLAQAGKLDEKTLKEYKYYDDMLEALGIDASQADEQIAAMIETINKMAQQNAVDILSNYKNEVSKLEDAYQKFQNKELIDANTLSALQDAFGDVDAFQEFQQAVMEGQTDLQHYFDEIVTEYAIENSALSEVTESTKEWTKQQLIASGITEESAEKSIKAVLANKEAIERQIRTQIEAYNKQVALDESTQDLSVSTDDLNKLTATEVSELLNAANASGTAAQQIALFTLKKELASGKSLRNADDIAYLKELIIQAGVGIELINQLQHLKQVADAQGGNKDEYEAFMKKHPNQGSWDSATIAEYNAKYADVWGVVEFEKTYDQVWDEVESKYDELFNYTANVGLAYGGAAKDAAKAGSDAAAEFKDALDKILAMYDAELDAGVISFQTYVDKSRAIIEQYYRDGKIKAQDYYDELASLYEKQVQQYDKVISAVQKRFQDETDALEKQKETIENSYNEQIEIIQKKIDALQDENDEIDRNLELSKAQ